MLKQLIQWEGFDGKPANQTLYFNLTRYEIAHDMELEVLEQRFKRFSEDVVADAKRDMTPPEIREMLDIFKVLIKHSYGVRSQDGKKFSKNEEIWNDFVETGAFDAFIFYMFEDANRANAFMNGIWPKEVQEAAEKIRAERPEIMLVPEIDESRDSMGLTPDQPSFPDDDVPSITDAPKAWTEYTEGELLSLNEDQFQELVNRSSNGKNVPYQLLAVGMKRNTTGQTE